MAWGNREWALVSSGGDWIIHIDEEGERRGDLLAAIDRMLVNGYEQIQVYFGPLVMKAGVAVEPEHLPVNDPSVYQHDISLLGAGKVYLKGRLCDLAEQLQEELERNCMLMVMADWREQRADAEERALIIAPIGALSRPSSLTAQAR